MRAWLPVLAAAAAAFALACGDVSPEEGVTNRPVETSGEGYVSSRTCRSCHPQQYASWHASYHRTMTQVATPESVLGDFDGEVREAFGQRHRLERRGDEFWVVMDDPKVPPAHPNPPQVERQIVMTTGSHAFQIYWFEGRDDREVGLSRFVWLIEYEKWVPFPYQLLAPPVPKSAHVTPQYGVWNSMCGHCHATNTRPRVFDDAVDTQVTELGIACEACHGPAETHVEANRDPLRRYGYHLTGLADDTISNPARLSKVRSSEVCGQCHSIFVNRQQQKQEVLETGFDFVPGEALAASRFVVQPSDPQVRRVVEQADPRFVQERYWSDGTVRVNGREYNGLLDTPCYQRGRGETRMTCLSCHEMHPRSDDPRPFRHWAADQLKPGMRTNRACADCHAELVRDVEAHSHHPADSTGSECMNCHMPYTTYGMLKAVRSHTIENPSVRTSQATGRPNGCNQCHLDRSLGWTADHLEEWYGTPAPELSELERAVPASLLWMLGGDAGQRALLAWSMRWEPALEASGREWMGRFLADLLDDPYHAVRFIAYHSLRELPGFRDFEYDSLAPGRELHRKSLAALARWREQRRAAGASPDAGELVRGPTGVDAPDVFRWLTRNRDDRVVRLVE